jgi:hypothetical protein
MSSADVDEDPAAGWHLWRSEDGVGAHYATRTGRHLSDDEIARGLAMTVTGDTLEELNAALREQADLLRKRRRGRN